TYQAQPNHGQRAAVVGLPYLKEVLDFLRHWEDKETNARPEVSRGGTIMRKNKGLLLWAITMVITALMLTVTTAVADQLSGTWKMNPEKSKYSPGPAPKDLTVVVESDENNYKLDATGTDGDGKPMHVQYSAKFDGKDHPATGIANADAVSLKRIDASTIETLQKKDGKVVMTVTTNVSKDGKTRTSTWQGRSAEGRDVHNVVVFDKQ